MTDAAAARKMAEDLIALAAKATPGPWFHRQAAQTRPYPHEDEEYDWIGDTEKGHPHSKVILQRQSLYGGAPDYAYIAACDPKAITALAQAFLSLSRPQAGTLTPAVIESFADSAVSWLCELPDRTSPEEEPEMCLVTGEELHAYLTEQLGELSTTPPATEEDA